jgi:ribonuclease HI
MVPFFAGARRGGWGFIIRDNNGDMLAAGAGNIVYAASALQTEALAAYKGIQYCICIERTCYRKETESTKWAGLMLGEWAGWMLLGRGRGRAQPISIQFNSIQFALECQRLCFVSHSKKLGESKFSKFDQIYMIK